MLLPVAAALLCGYAVRAQRPEPEVYSPLGKSFLANPDESGSIPAADRALAQAPASADLLLAAARARDALLRFSESIPLYTRGIDEYPSDVRFLRFRGHRFISTRRFDLAVSDLKRAVELAPASFDVSYHLALAYYLRGDYNHAAREYQRCLSLAALPAPAFLKGMPERWRSCYAIDDDTKVALADWGWRALRRAAKPEDAAALLASISETMAVKDNTSYHNALLLYKGLRTESQTLAAATDGNALPTTLYATGLWNWLEGRRHAACAIWERTVSGNNWAAFGFIAAEAELARGSCKAAGKAAKKR